MGTTDKLDKKFQKVYDRKKAWYPEQEEDEDEEEEGDTAPEEETDEEKEDDQRENEEMVQNTKGGDNKANISVLNGSNRQEETLEMIDERDTAGDTAPEEKIDDNNKEDKPREETNEEKEDEPREKEELVPNTKRGDDEANISVLNGSNRQEETLEMMDKRDTAGDTVPEEKIDENNNKDKPREETKEEKEDEPREKEELVPNTKRGDDEANISVLNGSNRQEETPEMMDKRDAAGETEKIPLEIAQNAEEGKDTAVNLMPVAQVNHFVSYNYNLTWGDQETRDTGLPVDIVQHCTPMPNDRDRGGKYKWGPNF